jgi:hypothetical protein
VAENRATTHGSRRLFGERLLQVIAKIVWIVQSNRRESSSPDRAFSLHEARAFVCCSLLDNPQVKF